MVDWVAMSKYASLVGTAMGIGLGITPIVPFLEIIKGKETVRIFPESMIFFNILCPHLWACYWIRQNIFIPFFSAIFGLVLALIFSTIYLYFYLGKSTGKWLLALVGKFAVVTAFHYFLLDILPSYHYIGTAAMLVGIFTSIAPAQNVLHVIRERNYKLIPICSTVFGGLCNFSWLSFGIMLKDIYNIIPNAICFTINLSNTLIWCYFYYTRDKKEEKEEPLKAEEEEH
jgi:uncharacterized protein with PQ loop repeat